MPKIVTPENAKEKWNFYMPLGLKLQMHRKLLGLGQQRKQSALIRALIRMFVDDELDTEQTQHLLELIEEETYIKPSTGETSVL
jgi:hypothetical protein